MSAEKILKLLAAANNQLKIANTGISIYKPTNSNRLSIRGTLPPKPGSNKQKPFQQAIPLGIYCNAAGIKKAKLEAQKLGTAIALGEFDWSNYSSNNENIGSCDYWVAKFEENYFDKRERNSKSETTWKDYQKIFNKFPDGAKLNTQTLNQLVLSTKPDTRNRQKACTYTKALAKFAGIDFDPTDYSGSYSPESVELRDIPSDIEIQQWRDRIPNKAWQYAFGLMAAYGLRNYELFHIDLESIKKSPGHLRILESKKNKKTERYIWCLYPEWHEVWQLGDINQPFPQITGKNNSALGDRVNKAFKRYGFNKPYNLRHAWAIRAINFIPVELAARMMDHSVEVHTRTYQRWINQEHYDRMYRLMMSRQDTPKPPRTTHALECDSGEVSSN